MKNSILNLAALSSSLQVLKLKQFFFIFLLLVVASIHCKAQTGSSQNLDSKNGYKGIILGSNISTLKKNLLTRIETGMPPGDSVTTYSYGDSTLYKLSNDITILGIGVNIYKNKILSITLIYNRNDGYALTNLFYKAYGIYFKPNKFEDVYKWNTEKVALVVNFQKIDDTGYAIYSCNSLQSEVDKRKLNSDTKAVKDL